MRETRITLGDGDYGYGTVQYGPVADSRVFSISSPFGPRGSMSTPNGTTAGFHQGMDIAYPSGVPLVALDRCTVTTVQRDPTSSYGYFIVMEPYGLTPDDDSWYQVWYGHMLYPPLLNIGDVVETGGVVGYVGSTGMATGPHLHLEVRNRWGCMDPWNFLYGASSVLQPGSTTEHSSGISTPHTQLTSEDLVAYLQNGGAWVNTAPDVEIQGARVVKIILPGEAA